MNKNSSLLSYLTIMLVASSTMSLASYYLLGKLSIVNVHKAVPYALNVVIALPLVYIYNVLKDLNSLKEVTSISDSERRRLNDQVGEARTFFKVCFISIFFVSFICAGLIYSYAVSLIELRVAVSALMFALIAEIQILISIWNLTNSIADFKAEIITRAERYKAKSKILKSLN